MRLALESPFSIYIALHQAICHGGAWFPTASEDVFHILRNTPLAETRMKITL